MKSLRIHFFGLLFFFLVISCTKKEDALAFRPRGEIVEVQQTGSLSKTDIVSRVSEFSAQNIALHDVTYYVITYRTEYMGKPIDTRGLLILPNDMDSIHMMLYCHGTQLPIKALGVDRQTPSNYDGGKEDFPEVRNEGLAFASAGYGVFMPDYIGYGITWGKDHPYMYYPEMFKSNIDGMLAAKQFIADKGYPADNRLFITGWSQGGGACLSAHKFIQENYASNFTVVASSGLAGPYNFAGLVKSIIGKRTEEENTMIVLSWAIYGLNKFSGINRPYDQVWAYPVFDQFSSLFPPSKIPEEVFKHMYIDGIDKGTDKKTVDAMNNNSFHEGWTPVGKVFLHHGDADDIVPYFNSVDAYNGLTAAGGDVKLYTYPGGTHTSEQGNYVLNTIKDFKPLQ